MKFIKLSQRGTVERQGKYGWEPETVYEPVFVAAGHIVSMFFAGVTILKMTSGERIDVKETPEEIIAMLTEGASNYHITDGKRAHRLPGERRRAVDQRAEVPEAGERVPHLQRFTGCRHKNREYAGRPKCSAGCGECGGKKNNQRMPGVFHRWGDEPYQTNE